MIAPFTGDRVNPCMVERKYNPLQFQAAHFLKAQIKRIWDSVNTFTPAVPASREDEATIAPGARSESGTVSAAGAMAGTIANSALRPIRPAVRMLLTGENARSDN